MEDSATVGVSHRVTHIHKPTQKPAQLERAIAAGRVGSLGLVEPGDRILEAGPADEAHGVEGTSVLGVTEAVDRNDASMLEAPGDLGFVDEAGPALGIVGLIVPEFASAPLPG